MTDNNSEIRLPPEVVRKTLEESGFTEEAIEDMIAEKKLMDDEEWLKSLQQDEKRKEDLKRRAEPVIKNPNLDVFKLREANKTLIKALRIAGYSDSEILNAMINK